MSKKNENWFCEGMFGFHGNFGHKRARGFWALNGYLEKNRRELLDLMKSYQKNDHFERGF